ncbi:MAG: hypothetical protein U0990_12655 [Candidatus Nanopelagicales bacterium]|nr:hypothetical protein [Candidatus Nanopelagicales bacterium]
MNDVAEKAQEVRDLRSQIEGMQGRDDEREIIFQDRSARRRMVTLYSMMDGEPVQIRQNIMEQVLNKPMRNPDGSLVPGKFMFTAHQSSAPEYIKGTTKCVLHPQSEERETLRAIGLGGAQCPSDSLGNDYAKEIHAEHRHKQEWRMYMREIAKRESKKYEERAQAQLDATLAIAAAAVGKPPK